MLITARHARLPVRARPALRVAFEALLLVPVVPRVADAAPAVLCKDGARLNKRAAAVARVVRRRGDGTSALELGQGRVCIVF